MSVFYVSSEAYLGLLKTKHEDGIGAREAQKRKVQCNNAYGKNRSNLGDGSEFGKFAKKSISITGNSNNTKPDRVKF